MSPRVALAYGRGSVAVSLPAANLAGVLRVRTPAPLTDALAHVAERLARPLGTPPLAALAQGRRTACVVVTDATRPTPNRELLGPLLSTLETAGLPPEAITLLVATGLHGPTEGAALREMLGEEIPARYRVVNHDAHDLTELVALGTTRAGTPVLVNRRFVEADLRVVTGLVEPHFMAGFSGGRKGICPGVAGAATIRATHSPRFLEPCEARTGVLAGNPFHEELVEIARLAGGAHFLLNAVVDESGALVQAFAGELFAAHEAAVDYLEGLAVAELDAPVDIVVTSAAGHPLDQSLYQTLKAMVTPLEILRPGGTILVASRCAQGLGSPDFVRVMEEFGDAEAFLRKITEGDYFVDDQWQAEELCRALRHARVQVHTEGVDPDTLRRYGLQPAPDLQAALEAAIARYGPAARVALIPKGPYVIPRLRSDVSRRTGGR